MAKAKKPATQEPEAGSLLTQIYGGGNTLPGDIKRILGVFNPRAIGTTERLMMRLDPDVAFGLAIVRSPIVNRPWSVDGEPAIAAFVDKAIRKNYRQLALGASNSLAFGHQVVEKVLQAGPVKVSTPNQKTGANDEKKYPNAWTYDRFKAIDPRTFSYLVKDDKVAGVEQFQIEGKKLTPAPRVGMERLVHWAFRSEDMFGSPHGFALTDQAYTPWYNKIASDLLCNRYFEHTADPPIKARGLRSIKTATGVLDGGRFLLDQVAAIRSGGGIWVPAEFIKGTDKWAYDVEFMQTDQRGQMFDGRLGALSIQILRALWITDKAATAGDGTGSLAQATEHGGRLDDMLETIVAEWLEILNDQVVKPLVRDNFGDEAAEDAGVEIRMAGITATKKEVYKDLIAQLIAAESAMAQGKTPRFVDRVDAVAMAEELGVPLRPLQEVQELMKARLDDAENAAALEAKNDPKTGEITDEDERKAGDSFKKDGIEDPE